LPESTSIERSLSVFGLELHPAVIHYPIALGTVGAAILLTYAILRRDWLRWFGPILLTIALAGAGAAYFSGESASDRAEHAGVPDKEIDQHESLAIWSIGVLALSTLLAWATVASRRGVWVAAPLAVAAAGLILWTAHYGGRLVFIYGAGHVKKSAVETLPTPSEAEENKTE
jgi:uncharacterized membrane protein